MTAPFPLFRERLRECRVASGYTFRDIGKRAGVPIGNLCDLENGKRGNPTIETVGNLAAALGVSPAYLLGVDVLTVMGGRHGADPPSKNGGRLR